MRGHVIAGLLTAAANALSGPVAAGEEASSRTSHDVPEAKQASLRLYVTATEAHEKWKAAPDRVKVLDVRTPAEYIFVGHAEMAWNIPVAFQTYRWDESRRRFAMERNSDFVSQVEEWAKPTDTILVICRSGARSAMTVDLLAEAGFTDVYTVIDGMEGDKVNDPKSLFDGKRMRNGWKNSGLPWTYDLDSERMRLPERPEASTAK